MSAAVVDQPLNQPDPGAPSKDGPLASALRWVLVSLNAIGTLWIFALMAVVNRDVFGRWLFDLPLDGVPEMIELSIVGIVFLQLGDATRTGRLTRSDGFFNFMLRKRPAIGRTMGAVYDLLGAVFMALILYGSIPIFLEAWSENLYIGEIGIFTSPTWPIKLVIVIGCVVTLLQFLAFALRHAFGWAPAAPVE